MSRHSNATPHHRPRVYWLDNPAEGHARAEMHGLLARSSVTHVAVVAHDAPSAFAGNTSHANTLSHVRALRQIAHDVPAGQVAYVAENTLSYRHVPFWTTTLEGILCNAPADWGVLQLAYTCGSATRAIVERAMTPQKRAFNSDACYVERAVVESAHAPFVPWSRIRTPGTTFYAVSPRGYRDILAHVDRHTNANANANIATSRHAHDPLYSLYSTGDPPLRPPRFDPNLDASHLFALTPTYTFHVPMFTTRCVPRSIGADEKDTSRGRLFFLVRLWHAKYGTWLAAKR
jgi:hypothetical protein